MASWTDGTPWRNRRRQTASGDVDRRELVAPRIEQLLKQLRTGAIDAETVAYAAYSIGYGDAQKNATTHRPDIGGAHLPEAQT